MRGIAFILLLLGCFGAAAPAHADRAESIRYVLRADAALAKGQPRAARIELLNATQADPGNPIAWMYQARVALLLFDGGNAENALDRAIAAGYPRDRTLPFRAHALLQEGQAQQALDAIPNDAVPEALRGYAGRVRANALAALGDEGGAAREYGTALLLTPKSAPLWVDVARFRMGTGEQAGAIFASQKAVALDGKSVPALTLRGILVREQYGLKAALPWFDKALAIDRLDLDAQLERAATLGEMGRNVEMLRVTRSVLALDPDNARAYYLQAALAARAHNFKLARTLIDRVNGPLADMPAILLLQSIVAFQEGNFAQATDGLSRLLAIQPDNAKARRLLAAAQWRSGDMRGVAATLAPISDAPDADSYALALSGRAFEVLGDRMRAATYLDRAALYPVAVTAALPNGTSIDDLRSAAEDSDEAPQKVALIRALLTLGRNDEALSIALDLERGNQGAPDAHMLAGDVLDHVGRSADALEAYRRAANLRFSEAVALRMIATMRKLGQGDAARQVLLLFVEQNPANMPARLLLADLAMGGRRYDVAAGILQSLRQKRGYDDVAILNNLAWCLYNQGEAADGLKAVSRAYRLAPANASLSHSYGWMLYRTGKDRRNAIALLEQALGQAPGWPAPRRHLIELLADRSYRG